MFLLVHSPLVGPMTWRPLGRWLESRGHAVAVPSLANILDGGPPYHHRLARAAASAAGAGSGPVTLIVHSGAGALAPYIAAALPHGRAAAVIFVDALLPHPGMSWFDTAPSALREHLTRLAADTQRLPPWHRWFPDDALAQLLPDENLRQRFTAELSGLPLAYFTHPAPDVAVTDWAGRYGYLRLSAGYDDVAAKAGGLGWTVRRLELDHLAMLTRPAEVGAALLAPM